MASTRHSHAAAKLRPICIFFAVVRRFHISLRSRQRRRRRSASWTQTLSRLRRPPSCSLRQSRSHALLTPHTSADSARTLLEAPVRRLRRSTRSPSSTMTRCCARRFRSWRRRRVPSHAPAPTPSRQRCSSPSLSASLRAQPSSSSPVRCSLPCPWVQAPRCARRRSATCACAAVARRR